MKTFWALLCLVLFVAVAVGQEADSDGRFLDDLLGEIDVHLDKLANQGSSIVKKVQNIQGQNGVSFTKTEVLQSYSSGGTGGNFPVGARFKRGLLDDVDDVRGKVGTKLDQIRNKVSGVIADGVNIGYQGYQKVKGEINNRLKD